MSTSTVPRDLAGIKHALELALISAALIIAAIMIVRAAHGNTGKLISEITTGQRTAVMSSHTQATSTWSVEPTTLNVSSKRGAKGRYESANR
jgi:hypothetical protein